MAMCDKHTRIADKMAGCLVHNLEAEIERLTAEQDTLHQTIIDLLPNPAHLQNLAADIDAENELSYTEPRILRVWADWCKDLFALVPVEALEKFHGSTSSPVEE